MANDTPDKPAAPNTPTAQAPGPFRLTDFTPPEDQAALADRRGRRLTLTARSVIVALSIVFVGLLGRVYQLQAYPDRQIVALQNSQIGTAHMAAMRGGLIDRTGRVLAATRVGYRLFCDPLFIEDRSIFAETIAYELGYDPVDIEKKLSGRSHKRYVLLDPRMNDEQVDRFRQLDLPGIYLEPITVRDYPQGELAGTLIGFVGRDGEGLEGLERHWEDRLLAKPGSFKFMRDYKRRRMWVDGEDYVPFEDGENVRLSIDAYIQRVSEEELAQAVEAFGAESGQIIVMQPNTGEILALATYPTYDPNAFGDVTDEMRRNRPVTDLFEPGSIFKPFVWAGLTELKAVSPGERIDTTTSGQWRMPNGRVLNDVHGKGVITWHDILKYSSNIGMAKGALRVDIEDVYNIMRSFGFGKPTGIDLPGEVGGLLTMPEHQGAQSYSHGSWPMGQEIAVTGVQVARAMCVLANGGVMVDPRIEAHKPLDEGQTLTRPQRIVSTRTAEAALYAMRDAVVDGTGKKANSPYFDLFGKTGTAQLPNFDTGGYHSDRYVSSFLGGAPVDQPQLVVGCFIKDPDRALGHYGGVVAAPAVRSVIERSLIYLGVPTNPGTDPTERTIERYEIIE
ncbi:MAG: peptidoglycan D,D-transpeptidase FtsI family protein [Phycisphaeraceae bacterium]